jgi:hypothetical protein
MMNNVKRLCGGLLAALILGSVSVGCGTGSKTRPDATMLTDKDSRPAQAGVIPLKEGPAFPVDAKRRPIAMIDDGEDGRLGDRPGTLQAEGKPMQVQERKP